MNRHIISAQLIAFTALLSNQQLNISNILVKAMMLIYTSNLFITNS